MMDASLPIIITMTLPRLLTDRYPTPANVKTDLLAHRIWPERVTSERWRLNHEAGGGYIVELEVSVPPMGGPADVA
jgi:hypothetical protein